jgi:hypothetical protein
MKFNCLIFSVISLVIFIVILYLILMDQNNNLKFIEYYDDNIVVLNARSDIKNQERNKKLILDKVDEKGLKLNLYTF